MSKANQSIGYLYLFYLAANPAKNNKIETTCYFEFADLMKSEVKEQINRDMGVSNLKITITVYFRLVPLNVLPYSVF
jgi:hypothetical protein